MTINHYYHYYHYYQNDDYHCGDDFDRGHADQYIINTWITQCEHVMMHMFQHNGKIHNF